MNLILKLVICPLKKDYDKPIKNYSDISKEKNGSFQSQINSSRSGYFSYSEDSQIGN